MAWQVSTPNADVPVRLLMVVPPLLVTATEIVTELPAGTFGPGAVPAAWPLSVGLPSVMAPVAGAGLVKYAVVVPVSVVPSEPRMMICRLWAPVPAVPETVQVVDWFGWRLVAWQVSTPKGDVPVRLLMVVPLVLVTVTATLAALPVETLGPGAAPAAWPFTVGAVTEIDPPVGAWPVKKMVTVCEIVPVGDVPLMVMMIVWPPDGAEIVIEQVVVPPAWSDGFEQVRLPSDDVPERPVIEVLLAVTVIEMVIC